MPNAPHHVPSLLASLAPRAGSLSVARPSAALGQFWYPKPPLWPAALSTAVHVALAAALIWTVDVIHRPPTSAESVFFIPPPQRPQSATSGDGAGRIAMASLAYFSGSGVGDGAGGRAENTTHRTGRARSEHDASASRGVTDTANAAGDDVYTSYEVDNVVEISYGSAVPEYPPDLLARGVRGRVTVRFVVDTLGAADVTSLEIVDSSDPQFAASVRAALPRMRFSPARLNGRRVRQLVEQPFRFSVDSPVPNSADSAV